MPTLDNGDDWKVWLGSHFDSKTSSLFFYKSDVSVTVFLSRSTRKTFVIKDSADTQQPMVNVSSRYSSSHRSGLSRIVWNRISRLCVSEQWPFDDVGHERDQTLALFLWRTSTIGFRYWNERVVVYTAFSRAWVRRFVLSQAERNNSGRLEDAHWLVKDAIRRTNARRSSILATDARTNTIGTIWFFYWCCLKSQQLICSQSEWRRTRTVDFIRTEARIFSICLQLIMISAQKNGQMCIIRHLY